MNGFVSPEEQEAEEAVYRDAGVRWASAWFASNNAEDRAGYSKDLSEKLYTMMGNLDTHPTLSWAFAEGAWSIERLVTGAGGPDRLF
jgi:hypothetical protein